jgi:pimeloyl-ACP methyl ester carboxylesterase
MIASPETIYFHGLPGAGKELQLFGPEVRERTKQFSIAKRQFPNVPSGTHVFELIADEIRSKSSGQPLRLVGFSLGASTALRVAVLLGSQVEEIDIISAAAPLQTGDYLEKMAGAQVFRIAQKNQFAFNVLSQCQSALSKVAPKLLYSMLFSTAAGNDLELRDDPYFSARMVEILRESLGSELATYRSEISEYVGEWSETLEQVLQPVSIYHGALDNWSPVEMAINIEEALKNCIKLEVFDDCSHYSTLEEYLQRV